MESLRLAAEIYNLRKKRLNSINESCRLLNLCIEDSRNSGGVVRVRKEIVKDILEFVSEYRKILADTIDEPVMNRFDFMKDDSSENASNCNKLNWISAKDGLIRYKNGDLMIAYQPGYPLMIADWKVGHGYRDVRTGESINPTRVAYIDLPDTK